MVHLHLHSNFSLLDGMMPIRDIPRYVKELGMQAVALTDHNALYGAIEFYQSCLEANIKPIIGVQISLQNESSLILLAQNLAGYQNLCKIISKGHLRGGHLNFQGDIEDVLQYRHGLFVLSGGHKGALNRLVKDKQIDKAGTYCQWMKKQFGSYFYIELQRFSQADDVVNLQLHTLAKAFDVPVVATNDVHFFSADDFELRQVVHAIDQNTLYNRVTTAGSHEQYLKSPIRMREMFEAFPEAITNTQRIAQACTLNLPLERYVFPEISVSTGESNLSYLRKLCLSGAEQCYKPLTPEITKRLNYELGIIDKLGFTDYFLIVKDIVDFCRRESIPCVGRGSAADSLVAYTLGVTFADPIRFNLYFERFLNEERSDAPDIDLDICGKNRDRVLQHVYDTYGADKTAMVCTYSTLQGRSAIREVAKTFGLPEEEIEELTRHIPYMGSITDLAETITKLPELSSANPVYQKIVRHSRRLADFPRHLSIHSGGVIIAPDTLSNYTPVEVAGKGWVISQYDMYSIEKLGLVKMDLLGVRSLSIITDCIELASKSSEKRNDSKFHFLQTMKNFSPLDLKGFPESDSRVLEMVNIGLTMGCFQLESPLMRQTLRKMRVQPLEDFPIAIAIIRPGVAHTGKRDQYIKHRAGLEKTVYLDDSVKDILQDTCGVPVFQEQVMLVAQRVAGFTLAQADGLRRAMTKSRKDKELVHSLEEQFLKGALANGYPHKKAMEIWSYLFRFTGFGFNKAHAATYGILAYQTAFLKCYFPVEFMVAVLNNPGAFYSTGAYISECRRLDIPILPPDVNCSEILFKKEGDAIRVGLFVVFELTQKTQQKMIEERRKGSFTDLYDFIDRTEAGQKEIEHLIRCGAFRSIHPSEPVLLLKTQMYFKNGCDKTIAEYVTKGVSLPCYTTEHRLVAEMEMLGFGVVGHPLTLYRDIVQWEKMVSSQELEKYNGRRVHFTGWYVTNRTHQTASGERMLFLTLEDLQGFCDIVFFPKMFDQFREVMRGHRLFTVSGILQSRMKGEANLVAEKVTNWPAPLKVLHGQPGGRD